MEFYRQTKIIHYQKCAQGSCYKHHQRQNQTKLFSTPRSTFSEKWPPFLVRAQYPIAPPPATIFREMSFERTCNTLNLPPPWNSHFTFFFLAIKPIYKSPSSNLYNHQKYSMWVYVPFEYIKNSHLLGERGVISKHSLKHRHSYKSPADFQQAGPDSVSS